MQRLSHSRSKTTASSDMRTTLEVERISELSSVDSSGTIIEKKCVPSTVNNKNLRVCLNRYFHSPADKKFNNIFKPVARPFSTPKIPHKSAGKQATQRIQSCVFDEFTNISSNRIWRKVMDNFKSNPHTLFNIIQSTK